MTKLVEKPLGTDGHILVVGGAGSGKSSCIAIPTLKYAWKSPALVIDIKGELYQESKATRRHASTFNPSNPSSLGYDPFYALQEARDPEPAIRGIALSLVPEPHDLKEPFWTQAAQDLLTGHLLFSYKQGIGFIPAMRKLQSTATAKVIEVASRDEQAAMYVAKYADLKKETLGSIASVLSTHIMLFATDSDIKAALTKQQNITPQQLEQGYDIFLQIPEQKLQQWKTLTSLIVQQFLSHFEGRAERTSIPILFLLDEFPRLGKIDIVLHGLATLRSKGITICLIVQSLAQLDATYGHDQRKVILDNCAYKAILNATDADTQEYFSRLVGTEERLKTTYSESGKGSTFKNLLTGTQASQSTSYTTEEKRVIRPEQFADLGERFLLFQPKEMPKLVQKMYHFKMPDYRLAEPEPSKSESPQWKPELKQPQEWKEEPEPEEPEQLSVEEAEEAEPEAFYALRMSDEEWQGALLRFVDDGLYDYLSEVTNINLAQDVIRCRRCLESGRSKDGESRAGDEQLAAWQADEKFFIGEMLRRPPMPQAEWDNAEQSAQYGERAQRSVAGILRQEVETLRRHLTKSDLAELAEQAEASRMALENFYVLQRERQSRRAEQEAAQLPTSELEACAQQEEEPQNWRMFPPPESAGDAEEDFFLRLPYQCEPWQECMMQKARWAYGETLVFDTLSRAERHRCFYVVASPDERQQLRQVWENWRSEATVRRDTRGEHYCQHVLETFSECDEEETALATKSDESRGVAGFSLDPDTKTMEDGEQEELERKVMPRMQMERRHRWLERAEERRSRSGQPSSDPTLSAINVRESERRRTRAYALGLEMAKTHHAGEKLQAVRSLLDAAGVAQNDALIAVLAAREQELADEYRAEPKLADKEWEAIWQEVFSFFYSQEEWEGSHAPGRQELLLTFNAVFEEYVRDHTSVYMEHGEQEQPLDQLELTPAELLQPEIDDDWSAVEHTETNAPPRPQNIVRRFERRQRWLESDEAASDAPDQLPERPRLRRFLQRMQPATAEQTDPLLMHTSPSGEEEKAVSLPELVEESTAPCLAVASTESQTESKVTEVVPSSQPEPQKKVRGQSSISKLDQIRQELGFGPPYKPKH